MLQEVEDEVPGTGAYCFLAHGAGWAAACNRLFSLVLRTPASSTGKESAMSSNLIRM